MKGIILAGGSGSRLYPLTKTTSKQLLPVYDKPMIYHPLSTLMLLGIKDILIISTERDLPNIEELLGDGSLLGIKLSYKSQAKPNGIAEAFLIAEDFLQNEPATLILGDNIFYISDEDNLKNVTQTNKGATIFGYHVSDPKRFGVIEYGEDNKVLSIEEKPQEPKSNYAAVGLYIYDNTVVQKAKSLKPSARGELEITDLNKLYLEEGNLKAHLFGRGNAWLDAGTPKSLLDASNFVAIIEQRQGLKIACIEEIAYKRGFINKEGLQKVINTIKADVDYRIYLENLIKEED